MGISKKHNEASSTAGTPDKESLMDRNKIKNTLHVSAVALIGIPDLTVGAYEVCAT